MVGAAGSNQTPKVTTSKLVFDAANGRLGIGTTTPDVKLTVNGVYANAAAGYLAPSGYDPSIQNVTAYAVTRIGAGSLDANKYQAGIVGVGRVDVGGGDPGAGCAIFGVLGVQSNGYGGAANAFALGGNGNIGLFGQNSGLLTLTNHDLFFGTNGSERMRITSAGNVGIGTSAPATKLDIAGALRFTPNTADTNYSADIFANYNSEHPFQINVKNNGSSAEYLGVYAGSGGSNNRVVFPTGNVGIGTSSPAAKLNVAVDSANAEIQITTTTSGNARFGMDINGVVYNWIQTDRSTSALQFAVGNTERLRITSAGDVGIGTTAPTSKLFVADPGTTLPTGITAGTGFSVARADGLIGLSIGYLASNQSSYLQAKNFTNTDMLPLLLNPSGGNVGIGTSSPLTKLDIDVAAVTPSSTSYHGIVVGPNSGSTSVGQGVGIGFRIRNTVGGSLGDNSFGAAVYGIQTDSAANTGGLAFYTRPNANSFPERMRIDSAGNVGIGTTAPSTSMGPGLHIVTTSGNSLILEKSNGAAIQFRSGTDVIRATISGINGADGLTFHTGAAQTERMRIDSSGNVGIGITSPEARLHIQGTSTAGAVTNISSFSGLRIDGSLANTSVTGITYQDGGGGGAGIGFARGSAYQTEILFYTNPAGTTTAGAMTERMRITSAGDVGIGTSSPGAKLHVAGDAILNDLQINTVIGGGPSSTFTFQSNNASGVNDGFVFNSGRGGGSYGFFDIRQQGTTKVHIGLSLLDPDTYFNINGNFGIGTITPTEKLEVNGNVKATGFIGNLSGCTVDGTNAVGFRTIPQNSQSAAYTLVLEDSGKHIFHPSADTTARTFTIPANSSVAFPIGTAVTFINQNGAGVITIAITTDTMRLSPAGTTGSRTLAANGSATAIKVTATEWLISGSGLT